MPHVYDWLFSQDLNDWGTPGVVIVLNPQAADLLGAFEEAALTDADVFETEIQGGRDDAQ